MSDQHFPRDTDEIPSRWTRAWPLIALAGLTFFAYLPACVLGFVGWDDPEYVTQNSRVLSGLTWESTTWAFSTFAAGNYHPLTWLSLMLDVEVFGGRPQGFHFTNVLLHVANVLLVFDLLVRMTGCRWRSGLVAGLLAVHPLHVESVAWISERKDVLSVFWGLWAIRTYLAYVHHPSMGRLSLVVLLHALSLLCKQTLVTLPCVLVLLDVWPLGRWSRTSSGDELHYAVISSISSDKKDLGVLLLEKWPLFLLSLIASVVVVLAQQAGSAVSDMQVLPIALRLGNSVVSYATYLSHAIWPVNLCTYYPHPEDDIVVSQVVVSTLLLVVLTAWALKSWRVRPFLLVGWLWYLGTLLPMIGLVQVGGQALADRYAYFPLVGIYVITVWLLAEGNSRGRVARRLLVVSGVLIALVLVALTWRQIGFWNFDRDLWQRAVEVTQNNAVAHANLAAVHYAAGDLLLAEQHDLAALRIRPQTPKALHNLAMIRARQERWDDALGLLSQSVCLEPQPIRHVHLGVLFARVGRLDSAVREYQSALRMEPALPDAHYNLGVAYDRMGRTREALEQYAAVLRLNPEHKSARNNYEQLSRSLDGD